jgi:hypothetical protein
VTLISSAIPYTAKTNGCLDCALIKMSAAAIRYSTI